MNTSQFDPLCVDEEQQTPLHRAAANGHVEVVSYFIIAQECKCLISTGDQHKKTPVHLAAANGRLQVVKFFTENIKWDPNSKSEYIRGRFFMRLVKMVILML